MSETTNTGDGQEKRQFDLSTFFNHLSLKHGLTVVQGDVQKEGTGKINSEQEKAQKIDFKFGTRYVGQHDFFRVMFSEETNTGMVHIQLKTAVTLKEGLTLEQIELLMYEVFNDELLKH